MIIEDAHDYYQCSGAHDRLGTMPTNVLHIDVPIALCVVNYRYGWPHYFAMFNMFMISDGAALMSAYKSQVVLLHLISYIVSVYRSTCTCQL